jgi:hypothetical protein
MSSYSMITSHDLAGPQQYPWMWLDQAALDAWAFFFFPGLRFPPPFFTVFRNTVLSNFEPFNLENQNA